MLGSKKTHKDTSSADSSSAAGGSGLSSNGVCSRMLRHVFENATPRDEQQAGVFEEYKPQPDTVEPLEEEAYLWNCLQACCEKPRNVTTSSCNVVLVFKGKCYHIRCQSNEACLPKQRVRLPNEKVQMVLVNPVGEATWPQLLKAEAAKQNAEILPYDEAALNFWKQPRRLGYLARNQVGLSWYLPFWSQVGGHISTKLHYGRGEVQINLQGVQKYAIEYLISLLNSP